MLRVPDPKSRDASTSRSANPPEPRQCPVRKCSRKPLAIGDEKANGAVLGQPMKIVATDANEIVLKDTGHGVLEERPKETTDALLKFL
jgi:hypothetical protein